MKHLLPLILVATISTPARAAELRDNALRLDVGFVSAVGEAGVTYTRSLTHMVQLEAGVGWGVSGVQLSLMPKLSVGAAHHRYVGGVGLAAAVRLTPDTDESPVLGWLNADVLGYEYRSARGFTLLVAIGLSVGIAGHYRWEDSREEVAGMVMPQGRIGVGYSF